MSEKLVIIGNGPAGHKFIETLVANEGVKNFDVTIFGEEEQVAYDRVQLTKWCDTQKDDSINMVPLGFYSDNNIDVRTLEEVISINRKEQYVVTDKGSKTYYDKLVIAAGAYPFVPPVPGHERDNCFDYRTIQDLKDIYAAAETATTGTVVGGGLLGLEAAKVLVDLGLKTNVVELAPKLMAAQLDDAGAIFLRRKIEALGLNVHLKKSTVKIVDGKDYYNKLVFKDSELESDIIIGALGIRPRDQLGRDADLKIGDRGGIIISDHCVTSDQNIYAIGECVSWRGQIFGMVAPCFDMARIAAAHLAGNLEKGFEGADTNAKLKLMGVDVASLGDVNATTEGCMSYVFADESTETYKKLVVDAENKTLIGAVLVGDTSDYNTLLQYYLNGIELPENPDRLILPSYQGESVGLGVDMLPPEAVICSCNDITKGQLCEAVKAGAHTLGDLRTATTAGSVCQGCVPMVGQVLNAELAQLGIEVNTDICEHFPYTRQELYHIVQVAGITTFDQLLKKHGTGHGCDVCKPTVGSILASLWADNILSDSNKPLQDTNDRYLGNIQKDGTYSVIPRMAAGEVHPDQLIAVANTAKKYNLYTKVVGAQRVALFGAKVEDLPNIWGDLIEAGMEAGQAYGKTLRMVKSCVGSTWCRFGVQDSTGMAVRLENRYKGIRTPHKVKMAVSGCTRECAEAQGKDFGVIATDKGWNLFVCGNGGMKPRHGDLFAKDINDETLIAYIDRLYMFYVRTADKLQRTSVWMENLDGGLEYLQDVIINDSLGICAELEQEIQTHIENFKCEWSRVVENKDEQKHFKFFINSDESDTNVVRVLERGQVRPATEQEKSQANDRDATDFLRV